MKILIIGGTGLISLAITRRLLDRGEDVILFNRGLSSLPLDPRAKVIHDQDPFEDRLIEKWLAEALTAFT